MDMRKGAAVKGDILETVKSFRFTPGKGLRGPEPFGCMNTGVAPVIMRSKATGKFLVGPELEVYEARNRILFDREKNKRILKGRLNPNDKRRRVYVFKTRAPAVAQFEKLVLAQRAQNDEMRAEYEDAKKRSQSSNPEVAIQGALDLSEF